MSSDPKLTFGAERFAFQDPAAVPPTTPAERTSPVWVHRVWLIIFVMFCIELGMLLAVLPWTRVWTDNSLLFAYPQLRSFMHQNFVRGAVTGLGLIDIWIGIWEAVHYRETK